MHRYPHPLRFPIARASRLCARPQIGGGPGQTCSAQIYASEVLMFVNTVVTALAT
jgi:hypothetical protein